MGQFVMLVFIISEISEMQIYSVGHKKNEAHSKNKHKKERENNEFMPK